MSWIDIMHYRVQARAFVMTVTKLQVKQRHFFYQFNTYQEHSDDYVPWSLLCVEV